MLCTILQLGAETDGSGGTPIVQVAFAVLYCLLSAGIVFGYAAIKPVLILEGVYRDRCTKEELDNPDTKVCYEQELQYGSPSPPLP